MRSVLISTGGTIAWSQRLQRMLSGAELVARTRVSFDEVVEVASAPSWDLSLADMDRIAQSVRTAIVGGAEAVVVTHGTDTLEESAWLTELVLGAEFRSAAGVVFTGAMRFTDDHDSDGPENLRRALDVSQAGARHDRGVQVAFAGRVHAARWVRKIDAWALDCFDSRARPPSAPAPPHGDGRINTDVALVKVGPLCQPALPDATGLVLEGTGAGHVPGRYHPDIANRLDSGRPVVVASRCSDPRPDPVPPDGALRAQDLTAEKAALALMVGLGVHPELVSLRSWWDELLAAGQAAGTA